MILCYGIIIYVNTIPSFFISSRALFKESRKSFGSTGRLQNITQRIVSFNIFLQLRTN